MLTAETSDTFSNLFSFFFNDNKFVIENNTQNAKILFLIIDCANKMQALRGSLSNIPNTVSNIIGYLPNPLILGSSHLNEALSSSSQSSISGDDISERSQAIPNSLIKEEWQLVLGQVFFLHNSFFFSSHRCKMPSYS